MDEAELSSNRPVMIIRRRSRWFFLALVSAFVAGAGYLWFHHPQPVSLVAFSRDDGIYTVPLDGGRPVQLIAEERWHGDDFAISDDGKWAVVLERASEEIHVPLVLYSLHPTRRIELPGTIMGCDVTFTPDNVNIIYIGLQDKVEGLFKMRIGDHHPNLLLKNENGHDWLEGPAYGPNGKSFVLYDNGTFARQSPSGGLWLIDPISNRQRRLTKTEARAPHFSPDGRKIVFEGSDGIYTISVDGKHLRRLTSVSADRGAEGHSHPTYSPDGRTIAYHRLYATGRMVSGGEGDYETGEIDAEIWVMYADGTGARRLCQGWNPCWIRSPR